MKKLARIVFIYVLLSSPPFAAYAQQPKNAIDVTVMFTELHANAPVGGCGCFWMAGGTGEVAIPIGRNFSAVGDISGEHAGHIPGFNVGLSLFSGMGGLRFRLPTRTLVQPYAQALFGGVHGFDSYFPNRIGRLPTSSDSSFAMALGGGVDLAVWKHTWIRAIQAEYDYSELRNLQGDRQNQVRLSVGIVYRIGGR